MKLLFLDTETTGLDAAKHGVIQISGIIEIDGVIKDEFDFRCRPFKGDMMTKEALDMHKLTAEDLKDLPEPQDTYKMILEVFDKHIDRYNKNDKFFMVGQNTKFDYDMMSEWFKKNGNGFFYAYIFYHLIDIVSATALFKVAGKVTVDNMKLETMAKFFNIELKAHNSLNDIRATREIFYRYVELVKQCSLPNS